MSTTTTPTASPTDDDAHVPPPSRAEREALAVARDPILARMLREERIESDQLDTALLWRLLRYVGPHKLLAATSVLLAFVEAFLMTLPAWLIGLAIDSVAGRGARSGGLAGAVGGLGEGFVASFGGSNRPAATLIVFFGLLVSLAWTLRWAVAVAATYLVNVLGQRVVHDIRSHVYDHVTGMDLGYFHANPVGRLVNRTTFDVQSISELFAEAFAQGLRDIIFILVLMGVMLVLDVPLALILFGAFPLLVLTGAAYRRFGRPAMRTQSAVQSRMNAWLAENLAGMRENQLYRREARRRAEFEGLTRAHQSAMVRVIRAWGLLRPVMMLVSAAATAVVLLVGYERVAAGLCTVGVLLTFVQYTNMLWRPVRNLTEKYNLIQTSLTAGERVMDVLDTRSAMVDAADADASLQVTHGEIEFRDVRFAYPGKADQEVLHGIDFVAPPGRTLALVGDTGAGKSTITHLLSRFYDPSSGQVLIDGHETRRYPLRTLRSAIALVPQDVAVFATTLRENITLGADIDDARVLECARAVRADVLIDRLEGGLDHVLEEGGRTLSTGERQLLSFARALVFDPAILVLDEATANVDTGTERLIQHALAELTAGRTSVIVAHRLSTIRDADQILVLRHGRIVERGRHEALLEQDGEYARLYELHMGAAA